MSSGPEGNVPTTQNLSEGASHFAGAEAVQHVVSTGEKTVGLIYVDDVQAGTKEKLIDTMHNQVHAGDSVQIVITHGSQEVPPPQAPLVEEAKGTITGRTREDVLADRKRVLSYSPAKAAQRRRVVARRAISQATGNN